MLATNFWKKDLGTRLYLSLTVTSEKGLEVSSPGTELLLQAAAHKEGVPLPGIPSHCICNTKYNSHLHLFFGSSNPESTFLSHSIPSFNVTVT